MKNLVKTLTICSLFSFCFGVFAKEMKIGVVDVQQLIAQSTEVKAMKGALERKFKPRQTKLLAMQNNIKADIKKLQRDATVLSASQKDTLQKKIVKERAELDKKGQAYTNELNMAQNKAMEKFFGKVHKVINKIAKDKHYDLVLQKNGVPFAADNVDLTKQVLAAL